jgi:FdhD protein
MLSGRASFEMVAKAARAGLPLVAAVSAPSALAVEAAEHWNVTLCGFCRGADVTCYAHAERLTQAGQDRRDEPGG